jgi:signal transduction histidine kinase
MRLVWKALLLYMAVSGIPLLIAGWYIMSAISGGEILPIDQPVTWLPISLVILATVMTTFTLVLFTRSLAATIRNIGLRTHDISQGNFSDRLDLVRRDEIGELSDGIDSMSAALEEYDQANSAQLLRETSKSEAVVHNIADGVIVTGLDDEVLVVNAPVEKWFGNNDEATDANGESEIDISNLGELIRETAEGSGNTVHSREITIELQGQIRSTILHARATRVENDGGDFAGVTTVLRDVTAEREIDRMKTELVSVVAHELRSPLVSIMGFSGILLEENLDLSTRLEFARIINDESNRMVEMINKFLDISRIESGKTQVVKVPTDVVELVRQVIDINIPEISAWRLLARLELPRSQLTRN